MIVRKLRPEDAEASAKVSAVAFEASYDISKSIEGFTGENWWGAFEDDELCSQMVCIPYQIHFDGHWTGMGGIGGVGTPPVHRRKGGVRSIYKELFPAMREAGQVFSYLYPFSHSFYRQFGYEVTYRIKHTTIPFAQIAHFQAHNNVRFYEPGDSTEEFNSIYEQYTASRNLAAKRSADHWKSSILPADPWKETRYAHVVYSEDGQPCAFFIYRPVSDQQGRRMVISDWAVTGADGLSRMFGFLKTFTSHYQSFEIDFPMDMVPELFLKEFYAVSVNLAWLGMVRVVDVESALKMMYWPDSSGSIIIKVVDDFYDWNNTTFKVDFESGNADVRHSDNTPNMTVDVQTLVRLMLGEFDLEEPTVSMLPGLEIAAGNLRLLKEVFHKKQMVLNDRF